MANTAPRFAPSHRQDRAMAATVVFAIWLAIVASMRVLTGHGAN